MTALASEAVPVNSPVVRCQLSMPNSDRLYGHILTNAASAREMCQQDTHVGQSVTICGAGPSLASFEHFGTHHVWGCNSALPYLKAQKHRVTHGFCVDQGEAMLGPDEWQQTFALPYYVSSSVHPKLVAHLLEHRRRLRFFHSFLGLPDPPDYVPEQPGLTYEMWLYTRKFPTSVQVGYGLNSVPRAVCLALFMGFSTITVAGADCACAPGQPPMPTFGTPEYVAWMHALPMYASGRTAICYGEDAVMAEAIIDGRRWHTRPDMVVSARHLLDLQRAYPGRITYVGDTLPNALADKDAAFMERMPSLGGVGSVVGFGAAR